jgi:Response regulators consisting of a CheY-like receiver domain and a winged-helix DNA-binding domain
MDTNKKNILLVEDEDGLRETLQLNLELENYNVTSASDGNEALQLFNQEYFDCIILDIMIPGTDGITLCEMIRLKNEKIPILFLSARNSSNDRVLGLRKGGDDYMTKPFNLEELLLRVQKLIEKNEKILHMPEVNTFKIGKGFVDFQAKQCTDIRGEIHRLTKKEAQFLKLLIENKNEVISREFILKMVWGYNVFPSTRTIDNFITTYRKHFEEDPRKPIHFLSVRGVGYKFCI